MKIIDKIISGGQTGIDRAALESAISLNINYDGYVPKGRISEDGIVPLKYILKEHHSNKYPPRTRQNVILSDIVIVISEDLSPGSLLTLNIAEELNKPSLHIIPSKKFIEMRIADFIRDHHLPGEKPLNVMIAGSRGSKLEESEDFWTEKITNALKIFI